jgi:hypothetical protein
VNPASHGSGPPNRTEACSAKAPSSQPCVSVRCKDRPVQGSNVRWRWFPGVPLLVGLLLWAARAEADPRENPSVALTYKAAAGCPDETEFRASAPNLGPNGPLTSRIHLDVTIEQGEPGFVGTLRVVDRLGNQSSRRIDGQTCSDVVHALAFLTRLVVELGGLVDLTAPAETAPSQPAASPQVAPVRVTPRSTETSFPLLVGLRGGFGPHPALSLELGVERGLLRGPFSPSGRLSLFGGESVLSGADASASLWFGGARLDVCPWRLGTGALVLRLCAGADIGAVRAEGRIAVDPRSVTELWSSGEATLRLQWLATKSFFVELDGGPEITFVRPRYYFEPHSVLYDVPWLTARGAGGVGVLF